MRLRGSEAASGEELFARPALLGPRDVEVFRTRVMHDDGRRTLLRFELELLAERDADAGRVDEREQRCLVFEVRARGIAEGVTPAAVVPLEQLADFWRIKQGSTVLVGMDEQRRSLTAPAGKESTRPAATPS